MGIFRKNKLPETSVAAMPIISDEEAAAILFGATIGRLAGNVARFAAVSTGISTESATEQSIAPSVVHLHRQGVLFGDTVALEAFEDLVQIDLGEEQILACDCCESVYQYFPETKSLVLFEGRGCKRIPLEYL